MLLANCTQTTYYPQHTMYHSHILYTSSKLHQNYILFRKPSITHCALPQAQRQKTCTHTKPEPHAVHYKQTVLQPNCIHEASHAYFLTCAMTEMVLWEQKEQDLLEWSLRHYQLAVRSSHCQFHM
jgi:hypothetical protein